MSTFLIVSAYPEQQSFGGMLEEALCAELAKRGHSVERSRLYQDKFNPVSFADDFNDRANPDFFNLEGEQRHAFENNTLSPQLAAEVEKLSRATHVIFVCPLFWSGPPALMKGWFEQVFIPGFAYDGENGKIFNNGLMKGKTSLFVTTMGSNLGKATEDDAKARAAEYYDDLCERPLRYCGFKTLDTVIISRRKRSIEMEAKQEAVTEALKDVMAKIDPPVPARKPGGPSC